MANFDLDAYFAARANADQKLQDLKKASDEKIAKLATWREQVTQDAAQIKAEDQAREGSWSGQLGLQPDSFLGNRVNDAASLVAGASRLAGDIVALPTNLGAMAVDTGILPPEVAARRGGAAPDRAAGKAIDEFFDLSKIVDPTKRNQLARDLGEGFEASWEKTKAGWREGVTTDVVAGVGELLFNAAKALGKNPGAVREYVLENAPQLLVGLAGPGGVAAMTAGNLGYAADAYNQGVIDFTKKNGRPPSEDEARVMALQSASLAAAEQVGDVVTLGATKLGKVVGRGAKDVAEDTARTTLKQSLKNVVKATGEGVVGESSTEGYQTYMEGEIAGKPASAKEIFTGAVIGGATGGVFAGGGRTIAEAIGATPEKAAERAKDAKKEAEILAAIDSGDVSQFTDIKSKAYNPAQALTALYGLNQRDDATPEQKQENLRKSNEIMADLQNELDQINTKLEATTVVGAEKQVAELEAAIANPDFAAYKADLEADLKTAQAALEVAKAGADPKYVKDLETQRSRLTRLQSDAALVRENLAALTTSTDISAAVEQVNAKPDTPEAAAAQKTAVDQVMNLAMESPDSLDPNVAQQLADNPDNGLSNAQRKFLRQFAEARVNENKLKKMERVQQEVLAGSKDRKYVGLKQYRERIVSALNGGRKETAAKQWRMLRTFAADHSLKDSVVKEAFKKAQDTGRSFQVISDGKRGWSINTDRWLSKEELKANGGLEIHRGSGKIVAAIDAEALAIRRTTAEMKQAILLKAGVNNVTDTAQQGSGESTEQQAAQVQSQPEAREVAAAPVVQDQPQAPVTEQAQPVVREEAKAEPTVEPAPAPQAEVPVVEQPAPVQTEAAEGKLNALTRTTEPGTSFKLRRFGDFFVQQVKRAKDAAPLPLVAVKDFITKLNPAVALQFLKSKQPLSEKQVEALRTFYKYARDAAPLIRKNLYVDPREKQEYQWDDLMQMLIEAGEDGPDLESNVKTAIAYGAFSWIVEAASKSRYNTRKQINEILGMPEENIPPLAAKNKLAEGSWQNAVNNAIGQRIVEALGLAAKQNIPQNMLPNLVAALGGHATKLLMDQGLVERTSVPAVEFYDWIGREVTKGTKLPDFLFVKLAYDKKGVRHPTIDEIADKVMGTESIIDRLFGTEQANREPSLEPIPFTQNRAQNSDRAVPDAEAEIIARDNNTPFFPRQDMLKLMTQMPEAMFLKIAGWKDPATAHHMNKKSIEAANDALTRELRNYLGYITQMADQKAGIFLPHAVWKQHRVGISSNILNPQASKIHRHALFRQAWDTTVDINDANQMINFRLRVAEGFGIKTDKLATAEEALNTLAMKLNPSTEDGKTIRAAVNLLVRVQAGETLTEAEHQVIVDAAALGKEEMHTLDALQSMAAYTTAKRAGKATFQTQLTGEIDGVTNGPMFSHFLLGAAADDKQLFNILNRGGFYELDNDVTQYNEWRGQPGRRDLYENTTNNMLEKLREMIRRGTKETRFTNGMKGDDVRAAVMAIFNFTGNLIEEGEITKDGRNIIKTPLTAMVFGSSLSGAVESMANNFIASIYAKIEKVAAGDLDRVKFLTQLNQLLEQAGLPKESLSLTTEKLMTEYYLDDKEVRALKQLFQDTIGLAVRRTIQQDFAAFIERRRQLNESAQIAFAAFDAAYQAAREEKIAALVKSGEIEVDGTGRPLHDLTPSQEMEVRKNLRSMTPILHTAFSKASKNGLDAGLMISKSDRKLSPNRQYHNEVHFGTKFADGSKTMWVHAYQRFLEDPGVSLAPLSIHSFDSYVSHVAALMSEMGVLNIHDAHAAGLANFQQVAKNLNQTTWNALLEYSPTHEMAESLSRTLRGMAQAIREDRLPVAALQSFVERLAKIGERHDKRSALQVIQGALEDARQTAYFADKTKFEAMLKLAAIDQYALSGGNYIVSDTDRAAVQAKMNSLVESLTPEELEATKILSDAVEASLKKKAEAKPVEPAKAEPAKADAKVEQNVGTSEQVPTVGNTEEADPTLKQSSVLELPMVHALQLVEVVANDETVPQRMRDQLQSVFDYMVNARTIPLKQALLTQLKEVEAVSFVQLLQDKYNAIPQSMWWGRGEPRIAPNQAIAEFLGKTVEPKVQDLMVVLAREFAKDKEANAFNMELLKRLHQVVAKDLRVFYITPATSNEMVLGVPAKNSRGWYSFTAERGDEVYFLSPDFVHSGLTPEVVLHELVHAAIAKTIEVELAKKKADPNYTSPALELIEDLDNLRMKILKDLPATELAKYAPALANIHEMTAWGMTNQGFQKDVLSKVTMASKTRKNELVTGFKAFVKALVGIFFNSEKKSVQSISVNGMTTLINNVSGLMAQAARSNADVQKSIKLAMESPVNEARTYSTTDILNALPGVLVNPSFKDHLTGLMEGIVTKLHGPFGSLKAELMENQARSPMDVWVKAQELGRVPFASQTLGAGFSISEQEAFAIEQIEVTVKAALDSSEARTKLAYKALSDLYTEAKATMRPRDLYQGDWDAADAPTKARIQLLYNYLFKVERTTASGKSDYLARFAALGLGSQQVNKALQFATQRDVKRKGQGLGEKLRIIFDQILEFFQDKYTHTFKGQRADLKLEGLVGQLVDIEAKNRYKLEVRAARGETFLEKGDAVFQKVGEFARDSAVKALKTPLIAKNKLALVRAPGLVARAVLGGHTDSILEAMADMRDREFKGRHGIVAGLMDEFKSPSDKLRLLLLAAKNNERTRQNLIANTQKTILSVFEEGGGNLTPEQKAGVTAALLRSGAGILLKYFTMQQLEDILRDPAALQNAIQQFEGQFAGQGQLKDKYIAQIRALGKYKATGESTIAMLLLNSHNIARLHGTGVKVSADTAAQVEPMIAPLVALYAIKYNPAQHVQEALSVVEHENARTDGQNGVEFILKLHQRMEQESKERLFNNDPTLMMHGYTPEIMSPYIEPAIANAEQGEELKAMGYVEVSGLQPDPFDPDKEQRKLYVQHGVGMPNRVTGAVSNIGKQAKGSHKHGGWLNPLSQSGIQNAQMNAQILANRQASLAKAYAQGANFDPNKVNQRFMIPVLNEQGDIVNWRYTMEEATRDNVLQRDNRFERVLGVMAGSIFDKATAREQNMSAIKVMKEMFDNEYATQSHRYMKVGPDSPDPAVRETWALLPFETKEDIKRVWGREGLMVRTDAFYTIFGAQKLSAATMFKKAYEERKVNALMGKTTNIKDLESINGLEKFTVWAVESALEEWARYRKGYNSQQAAAYAKQAAALVMKGERVWQELVRETKDIIVVKTGVVLAGNIWSNFSLLMIQGVPITDIIHHHTVAFRGARQYFADTAELARLKHFLDTGYTQGKDQEYRTQIARLEDAIARNPVTELVNAGLMPTIVEDLSQADDPYSYKSQFAEKVEGLTSKLNPNVLEVAKQAYMAHETSTYKFLSHMTQLSDFVARYTMYQHEIANGVSKQEAVLNASSAFVNYDIPMQPGLQYIDDMGFVMFTKYFFRIQHVLLKTAKEHPTRVMMGLLLDKFLGLGPIVLDGTALARIPSWPFEGGALRYPGALAELGTVQAGMAVLK